MLERLLALLQALKAEGASQQEVEALMAQIDALKSEIEAIGILKTEHATFKQVVDVIGDKDAGELVGFADAMKKIDLDTPEKIIALKAKADGDSKTATEQTQEIAELKKEMEKGSALTEQVKLDSEKALLLADVKVGLSSEIGQANLFGLAIDAEMGKDKFTRSSDGSVLYDGKALSDSLETLRETYGAAFKELPSGGGGGGGGNGDRIQDNKNKPTMADRMKKGFK